MSSLYHIGQQYEALAQMHDDATDADAQHIVSVWLQEVDDALEAKATNCIRLIKQWEADASVQKFESVRLATLATANKMRVERLKQALKEQLEKAGMTSVKTVVGNLTLQGAGGKQAVLGADTVDLDALAEAKPHLVKTTVTLNKLAVHAALLLGEEIDGLSLAEPGTIMVIR